MRKLSLLLLLSIGMKLSAQTIANPGLEQVYFTDVAGTPINDTLPLGYVADLNIPIQNTDPINPLPVGSCKIKIGLGSKMMVSPSFNLSNVITSNYFTWTVDFIGGQYQLTGDLTAALPANFTSVAKFNVQGNVLGYSTITANFLISNHNTSSILSDEDPTNNTSFRQYKIIESIVPVTFNELRATKENCNINLSFNAENEINVANYEIQVSMDGRSFQPAGTITAANLRRYTTTIPITSGIATQVLYIRIKSIDRDNSFAYSKTLTLNSICNAKATLGLYPNPVQQQSFVIIHAAGNIMNGKYRASLFDESGRLLKRETLLFNNIRQYQYLFAQTLATGTYLLKLDDETNPALNQTFKINKL